MKTLVIIDMQNDFLSHGALEVKGSERIIPLINQLIPLFDHVVASQDWHPKNHVSFAKTHGKKSGDSIFLRGRWRPLWKDHCIQSSKGAKITESLHQEKIEFVAYKGTDKKWDSYSAFFDDGGESTHLFEFLKKHNLFDLYFVGVATEYCVKFSVLDALSLGFSVFVIRDAIAALHAGEEEKKSLDEMKKRGAKLIESKDLFSRRS